MTRVAFVSCVKTKADRPMPAKDLYISPWFRMARDYAERNANRWFILSAEHGLLHPDDEIAPYEATLNRMPIDQRVSWTLRVSGQLELRQIHGDTAMVLAGKNYRSHLYMDLMTRFREIDVPMARMTMGRQLSWLSKRMQ